MEQHGLFRAHPKRKHKRLLKEHRIRMVVIAFSKAMMDARYWPWYESRVAKLQDMSTWRKAK